MKAHDRLKKILGLRIFKNLFAINLKNKNKTQKKMEKKGGESKEKGGKRKVTSK